MPKSRSEIQKAYRERQKAKGSSFLEKERVRQQQYYKPAADLSARKRAERNEKNKFRNRLSRLRKREREQNPNVANETSGYESAGANSIAEREPCPSRLVVQLPALTNSVKSKGLKKVRARALATANKKVRNLKQDIETLRRKVKVRDRKITRMNKKLTHLKQHTREEFTPKKQTERDIEELNLTPNRRRRIRRKLLNANIVMAEVKAARDATSKRNVRICTGSYQEELLENTGVSQISIDSLDCRENRWQRCSTKIW